jgi:hypothetical protein
METPKLVSILNGCNSFETAHLTEDYPYGSLRCKRREWVESNKRGDRFVTCTTNPKKAGEVWNKPHAGTYSAFIIMGLDEKGYVQHLAASGYGWHEQYEAIHPYVLQLSPSRQNEFRTCERMSRAGGATSWAKRDAEVMAKLQPNAVKVLHIKSLNPEKATPYVWMEMKDGSFQSLGGDHAKLFYTMCLDEQDSGDLEMVE